MKARTLLPMIAICLAGPLSTSCLLADHAKGTKETKDSSSQAWGSSQMMGATVKDLQGDNLGTIKDVLLDPPSGKAEFAIIELSGEVGPRGVYAPVPWSLLKPTAASASTNPKTFVLNVNRDQFASAKKFYLNQWPDSNAIAWAPDVYSYYGLDYRAAGFGTGATGASMETTTGHYYGGMKLSGPFRADGTPIDNGTAPDGKGTFNELRGHRF